MLESPLVGVADLLRAQEGRQPDSRCANARFSIW